jgi:hypothetical protein
LGEDVSLLPTLEEVLAVVDRDTIEPRTDGGITAERVEVFPCLQEHILHGILCLGGITEEAQGEIIYGPAMFCIDRSKFG